MKKCITSILLLLSLSLTGQTQDSWPIFRGDAALTGVTQSDFPESLHIIWMFETEDQFKSSPVLANGIIVVTSMDGSVYGLNLKGEKQWLFSSEDGFEASALILNDKVYVGDMSGKMHCLALSSGKKLWEYKTDGQIMGSANSYNIKGIDVLMFGSYDYFLYALNAESGELLWKYESDNYINGAPACLNGNAVFGGCDGFLHMVDIASGKLIKKVEVATYVAGSPLLYNDLAFLGDYDGRFSCVDLVNSKVAWMWEDETKNLPFISSPSLINGDVFAGCRDKFIYSYNIITGDLNWSYNTGSRIDASVVVNAAQILVVNMRGDIIIMNQKDGAILTSFELGIAISGTPAVSEQKLIVAAEDGIIYCLGKK